MNFTSRLIAIAASMLIGMTAANADPVPLPCDPAKDCPPLDPCKLAPEKCKPQGGPIEKKNSEKPKNKTEDDPCKYCICPAPTVPSCRKCCG